jgi:hypothetical protein
MLKKVFSALTYLLYLLRNFFCWFTGMLEVCIKKIFWVQPEEDGLESTTNMMHVRIVDPTHLSWH